MNENEKHQFVKYLTDALAFYGKDASAFAISVWFEAMRPFDLEQVKRAMSGHAMDPERGQFAPKPADIVRQLAGTSTDRAALAWGAVFECMQRIGAYTDVAFDDPAIHAVIRDLGGWIKLCRSTMEELGFVQNRFAQAYKAYSARGQFDYPSMLSGDNGSDADFAIRGMKKPEPTLIGNKDAARLVMQFGGQKGQEMRSLGSVAQSIKRVA